MIVCRKPGGQVGEIARQGRVGLLESVTGHTVAQVEFGERVRNYLKDDLRIPDADLAEYARQYDDPIAAGNQDGAVSMNTTDLALWEFMKYEPDE